MKVCCEECGSEHKVFYSEDFGLNMCMSCYKLNSEHPVNSLPKKGEILYDAQNRPICHICGRAYNKLMSHARLTHGVSAKEYKEMFSLSKKKGIVSPETAELLRAHVRKNYEIVVSSNLMKGGSGTRFEKGYEGRTKDKLSLQELNAIRQRNENKKKKKK